MPQRVLTSPLAQLFSQVIVHEDTDDGEGLVAAYRNELLGVETPEALHQFVAKWRPVWGMDYKSKKPMTEVEASLIDGSFDAVEALQCIALSRRDACPHILASQECCGVHIVMPPLFIIASMVALKYKVPTNVALIQMTGGYEQFYAPHS